MNETRLHKMYVGNGMVGPGRIKYVNGGVAVCEDECDKALFPRVATAGVSSK